MQILKIYPNSINERFIDQAVEALADGQVIIYPTDTLYAYGCDALNRRAIEHLCRIKGLNPDKNLLSIVCADIAQAAEYTKIDNRAFRILKQYLPGPYTFILPPSTTLPKAFRGRKSVGVRVPDDPIARQLARRLERPLLTSSVVMTEDMTADPESIAMANTSVVPLLIDAGTGGNEPSTIVDITNSASPEIIRQGLGKFEL